MSLNLCIPGMVERGEITPEQGAAMAATYGELELVYRRQMSPAAASAAASEAALAKLEREALLKKRQELLQVRARQGAVAAMARYDGGKGLDGGVIDPRAAEALFAPDGKAPYSNIDARRRAIRGRAHAMMDKLLAAHRRTLTGGQRDAAGEAALARAAIDGEGAGTPAGELAEAWRAASEMLRERFNAAGGAIGKLERWGLPQSHDPRALRKAGFAAWRDDVLPGLDRARMIDPRTDAPFSDEALELALRAVYATASTDGWAKITPGAGQGRKLANQRQDHRFLHFKDGEAWLAYNAKYGRGGVFDAMMGHVDALSRDIALIEILGPNPTATVEWLKQSLMKSAQLSGDDIGRAVDRANGGQIRVQRLYDEITGELSRPESRRIALGFSAVRSWQTAAKLGGATLSAVADLGFGAVARKFNGLPAVRMLPQYLALLRPGAEADRKLAVRLGLIAEEWSNHAASQHRYLGEELVGEKSRRLAEFTLRVSGLAHFTQSGRWAFGMELLGFLTDQSVKVWDSLPGPFRAMLERYGIGADGWDRIRATPLEEERGVPWLKPSNVEDRALGDRLLEMIVTETDYAVPVPDVRTRAMMNSVAQRGTWWGETLRSTLLFKSFGISVMLMQARRLMDIPGAWSRARYAAGLFAATTVMGGVALQLKEIAKGKDPRPMWDDDDPTVAAKFAGAATLQGGGWGIFGDFLGSSTNRFGGGFGETLAGPTIGLVSDIGQAGVGNAQRAIEGEDSKLAADMLKVAKGEIPVASSLWYQRLAFERLVLDQMQATADPDHRDAWRRMERRAGETGQDYWWRPGEIEPERAPAWDNLVIEEGGEP